MTSRVAFLAKIGFVLRSFSLIAPCIVMVGWMTDNVVLKKLVVGSDAMNPMTALLFILLTLSIIVGQSATTKRSRWTVVFSTGVIMTSSFCLLRFFTSLPFRLDHLLFGQIWGEVNDGVNPMAPATAVLFILISVVEILQNFNRRIASEGLLIGAFTLFVFFIAGYTFKIPEFHSSIRLFPASQTCFLFGLIIFAIAFSKPKQGIVGLLVSDFEGARIGRNFIAFTIIIPVCIAYARMQAQWHHLISTEMGVAIVMGSYIFIFGTSLVITVASLNKRDHQRKEDEDKINELNEELKAINNRQQELIKELAAANEELQASDENLRATNDELLATNEKLEEAVITIKMQNEIIIQQKEEALKRSREYLEIIFSNTEEEILLLDAEGKILMYNQALRKFIEKATGKRPKIGMYVWDITVPARAKNSKELFERAVGGEVVMAEAPLTVDGKLVVHLLKYEPVWVDRKIKYVTLISLDITDQKQASEQLKDRVDQLQKTNYELDRFVYSVSHDLRAPLSSILGLVNVAEMESGPKETPYLNMIKGRINTLDTFIRNILDYSRNSRTDIQYQEIDFQMLIDTTKDSLRTMAEFGSLNFVTSINQTAPFYSDALRITTVFNNLFSNAIRFQDRNKSQSVLEVEISCHSDARIIIRDNGIGIAPEHQSKIFNMFYRATDKGVGSGIGLYLVKETVSKLKGTIKLTSELGLFTEFEITLPNMKAE